MPDIEETLLRIQAALEEGNILKAGSACAKAGQIYLERNLYQEAAHYYQEASKYFASATEIKMQAKALNHLGICLVMDQEPQRSLEILKGALLLLESNPDNSLKAAINGNLGLAYSALADHQNAIKAHKSVMEAAEAAGDEPLRLNALINLADSNLQHKNYQSALGFALVAQDLAKELNSQPSLVIIYDLLGMVSSRQGNLREAVEYHVQSYQSALAVGDLLRQAISLANKGLALEGLTEMERALDAMSQAEELFRQLNSSYADKTRHDLERVRNSMS